MLELLNILLRLAQIAAGAVVIAWAVVRMVPKKECPCDRCKNLELKRPKNDKYFRYQCKLTRDGFDAPPEYCSKFEEREINVVVPKKEEPPKEEKPTKRNDNKMRTLEQIDRDIAFVRYDIEQLRKMHSPISVAADDLLELYDERRRVVEAMKEKGETAL